MSDMSAGYGASVPAAYGGGDFLDPSFRDTLDARRSMWRRTPDAEYPDGYLGTIIDRREDRLLQAVKGQLQRRVYDRGVHKGERIDQGDYFWPPGFMQQGLVAVARGVRQAPAGTVTEHLLINDGKTDLGKLEAAAEVIDPVRRAQLASLRPTWR